jgi:hypothetical protein
MKNALAVLAVTSCIVPLCRAATPPPVPESLLACRKLQDDGERVRCYDAQIAKLVAPAAGAATAVSSSAARFGAETLPPAAQPKSRLLEETALLSSITALRKASSGTYTISLSNGQIWRQEESSQVAQFFRVGDDVRIEKAALGSYHMSTSSTGAKNWVRVTRIQ